MNLNRLQASLSPFRMFLVQSAVWLSICLALELVSSLVLNWHYPYDWPLLPWDSRYADFRDWAPRFSLYHHLGFFHHEILLMYPAPVALVYKLFSLGNRDPHAHHVTNRFLAILLLTVCVFAAGLALALVRRGLSPLLATTYSAATLLLSYPFWFEFSRANMEFVVWILISLGIYLFCIGRTWEPAVLFGIAASMKIFPFVFMGLLISRKQYRQVAFGIVVAALVTLASLWLLYPDIRVSYRQTSDGLRQFKQMYMLHIRPLEIGFDHSLFALIKRLFPVLPPPEKLSRILSLYLAAAAAVGTVTFFLRIQRLPLINQVTCLTVCSILLPPTSYDYTLLHLYAPLAMLLLLSVDIARRGQHLSHPAALTASVACFALLLSPQSEFIFHAERFGGQIKAVTLLALLYIAVRYPFQASGPASEPSLTTLQPETAH